MFIALITATVIVAAEMTARLGFGLGNPPIYVSDPDMEYLPKPSQEYHRFGHRVAFNRYSMRSDDFPQHKQSPDELRVLVIGDSVVNGGDGVDQSDLATELLKSQLAESLHRPVTVGNISAPSWGPPNELAYLRRFGLFDADVVILVFNYMDTWDIPRDTGGTPDTLKAHPTLGLVELVSMLSRQAGSDSSAFQMKYSTDVEAALSLSAVGSMFRIARNAEARIAVVAHLTEPELNGADERGTTLMARYVKRQSVECYSTRSAYIGAANPGVDDLYRDQLHLSARGQEALANVLYHAVLESLKSHPDASAAGDSDV